MTPPLPPVPPADPAPLPPEQNIGPYYRILGLLGLLGTIALALIDGESGKTLGWPDVALLVALGLVSLALIRPNFVDVIVRQAATHLPGRYGSGGDR